LPPILADEAACIDIQYLPVDPRHAILAAPGINRVVARSCQRNERVIRMLATPLELSATWRSADVRPAAHQIGTHRANQHTSVGTAEHGGFHCHVRGHRCTQRGAGCRHETFRYRPQRIIVDGSRTVSARGLSMSSRNRPRREHSQHVKTTFPWRPGRAVRRHQCQGPGHGRSAAVQLNAQPAGEHHLGLSGQDRAP